MMPLPYRVLYVDADGAWAVSGDRVMRSRDGGRSWQPHLHLPPSLTGQIPMGRRWVERLLRRGVHHLSPWGDDALVVFRDKEILLVGHGGELRHRCNVHGSRPLGVTVVGDALFYGEYTSNPERRPVCIFRLTKVDLREEVLHRLTGIRHVHGIYRDPYTERLWVTTGDYGDEAAIWSSDDGLRTLTRHISGGQQTRAVSLVFTPDNVLFGTDTPLERNYIYQMARRDLTLTRRQAVGAPVFWSCAVGAHRFLSTACEPSAFNTTREVEVWGSSDGGANWSLIRTFRKDPLPMRWFQYGQVRFPAGPGDGRRLWMVPMATWREGKTYVVNVDDLA